MGGFAGFGAYVPFDTSSMSAALNSSAFTPSSGGTSSGGYIPKGRQAQTAVGGGDYPALGSTTSHSQQPAVQKKELEDPCDGKPKEFFIYSLDPASGICICTAE
jgi:hypothetical protein